MTFTRACTGAVLGVVLATALPAHPAAAQSDIRLFAAHALTLRAAGVEGDRLAVEVLADMPGSGMVGADESLAVLWRPFFENAIVKLGRLRASEPAAL